MNESYCNNVALNLYSPENEDEAEKYVMTRIALMLSEIDLINNNKDLFNSLKYYSENIILNNEERTTEFIYETFDNLFDFQSNRSLDAYLKIIKKSELLTKLAYDHVSEFEYDDWTRLKTENEIEFNCINSDRSILYDVLLEIIERTEQDDLNSLEKTILMKDSDKLFYEDKYINKTKEELETIKQEIHNQINLNMDTSGLFSKYNAKHRMILYLINTKCLIGLQLCNARLPRRTNDWVELNLSSIEEERLFIKFDLSILKHHGNLYDLLFHYNLSFDILEAISETNVMITDASGAGNLIKGNLYSFSGFQWKNIYSDIMDQLNKE